jgi:hypothetical protein
VQRHEQHKSISNLFAMRLCTKTLNGSTNHEYPSLIVTPMPYHMHKYAASVIKKKAGTAYPLQSPGFTPGLFVESVLLIVFLCQGFFFFFLLLADFILSLTSYLGIQWRSQKLSRQIFPIYTYLMVSMVAPEPDTINPFQIYLQCACARKR